MRTLLSIVLLIGCTDKGEADTDTDTDTDREPFAYGDLSCAPEEYCYYFVAGPPPETGSAASPPYLRHRAAGVQRRPHLRMSRGYLHRLRSHRRSPLPYARVLNDPGVLANLWIR